MLTWLHYTTINKITQLYKKQTIYYHLTYWLDHIILVVHQLGFSIYIFKVVHLLLNTCREIFFSCLYLSLTAYFFGFTLELGQTPTKIILALNEIHILVMMQGRQNLWSGGPIVPLVFQWPSMTSCPSMVNPILIHAIFSTFFKYCQTSVGFWTS